jgi:glycerol-3-phosphate dehydrogenase subunit B
VSDVVVIGGGLAGLAAALRLAQGGRRVMLVTKGEGGMQLSQGTVDVLGYAPNGSRVERPLDAIESLPQTHPYASIGVDTVRSAVNWLAEVLGEELLVGDLSSNYVLPTAVGAMRPTALAQPSMVPAHGAGSYAVVGVRQLKDYPADLLAGNLGCQARWVDLAPRPGEVDPSGLLYAQALDDAKFATRFAKAVAAAAPDGDVILLPAVLGTRPGVWREIAEQVGRPIAEVPLPPPSVPGIRLHDVLLARAKQAGVRVIIGSRVVDYVADGDRVASVIMAAAGGPRELVAQDFVYAAGGFASGSIGVDSRGVISETLFNLPLTATDANELVGPDYWAPHPLFEVGVRTDATGRVVDGDGGVVRPNLYVAGDLIAGAERWAEKSGEGIAAASAVRAANSILGGVE